MAKTVIHFIFMYIALVMAQVIVFNNICLFGVAVPLVFIYFIIKLPVTLSLNWVMTLSFMLGLTVDIFSDTQGMNALACTLISVIRLPILKLYFPREDEMNNPEPSMMSLGPGEFMKFAFSIVLVYCLLFFTIESFSFFNIGRLVAKIAASSLLTFVIITAIDSLISRSREKRL